MNVEDMLNSLNKSKFRSFFHLKEQDINFINAKSCKKFCTK